ncbi:bifunctional hydroxymethylpyrimidine kinase/phosphomethylpyrimidine kinase, partial [Paratractidigestivibacter sp.]|uniref:bifunctional hydroxymethylpyrimidine kinase/phosphomethylpyrimidine kinase n=1 Tax=Paratractidigestivibacter sp. TaxID=2847316 RepID=UPI0040270B38
TPNIPEAEALLGFIGSGGGGLANGVAKKGGPLECGDGTGSGGLADNWGNAAGERDVASGRNAVKITSEADAEAAARALAEHFGCAFLVKGGHGAHDANDVLAAAEGGVRWFRSERVDNPNTHGTGCTLSSAIACGLARGLDLGDAVVAAKDYLTGCLRAGLDLGRGSGPLDHMWAYRHRR